MLKLQQQYLGGNVTDRSTIPEHGGVDQPIQHDKHDYVEYGWGAEDQKKMGTHARGENKIKSKNTQDKSSTAGRLGGGLIFPQDSGGLNAQDQSSTAERYRGGLYFPPDRQTEKDFSRSILMRNGHQRLL